MASLVEDVARLRQVLEANSVSSEDVDENVLIALLDMHASDKQRVDLVLLELQNLLGKELIVGHLGEAQRERWKELQAPIDTQDEVLIVNEISQQARIPDVIDLNEPSTSGQSTVYSAQLSSSKRKLSSDSTESNVPKKQASATNLIDTEAKNHKSGCDMQPDGCRCPFVSWIWAQLPDAVKYVRSGQLSNQISIMELLDHLCDESYDVAWLKFLARFFKNSTSFTRQDKIVALEVIGALSNMNLPFFVRGHPVLLPSEFGLKCWREAMTHRYFPAEGEPLLPKIPDVSFTSVSSDVVFGSSVEVMSIEELDLLEKHFKLNFTSGREVVQPACKKLMQRQALLVIRRVTSQLNLEHPHWIYLKSLFHFGHGLAPIFNTSMLILEQTTGFIPKIHSHTSFDFFNRTLESITNYFIQIISEPPESSRREEISFANLLLPTQFIGTIAKFLPAPTTMVSLDETDENDFRHLAELVFSFVIILESITPRLSSQEKQKLEEYYSNYIRELIPERTTTVLHVAARNIWVEEVNEIFKPVENLKLIKLILKLGADPNAINEYGQTPLHILAEIENIHLDRNVPLFQFLVDAGGHLDFAADNGDTVLSVFKNSLMQSDGSSLIAHPYFESLINSVCPLSCLCARVIRRHGIRFNEEQLPLRLCKFVSLHSAEDPNEIPLDEPW